MRRLYVSTSAFIRGKTKRVAGNRKSTKVQWQFGDSISPVPHVYDLIRNCLIGVPTKRGGGLAHNNEPFPIIQHRISDAASTESSFLVALSWFAFLPVTCTRGEPQRL